MNRLGKTIVGLFVVWLILCGVARFGAFTGDVSLMIVAVVGLVPVGFLISMLARQIGRG